MLKRLSIRLYAFAATVVLVSASPANAQYGPRPLNDPATGEVYHIEAAAGLWVPTAEIIVASESLGITGTQAERNIYLARDLGLTDQRFPELQLELRAARKHKFRFQYIPIEYQQGPIILSRDVVFNGQRYRLGLPVQSTFDWKAYRFGYEYDFITTNRGFGGFILDVKYSDVKMTLTTPLINEFVRARAAIPAIGGVARVYVLRNFSITGEVTGFALPHQLFKDKRGHYLDVDVYGTLNFTNNMGVQLGYRSFDVGYVVKTDTGSFKLKGLFFGVVARY